MDRGRADLPAGTGDEDAHGPDSSRRAHRPKPRAMRLILATALAVLALPTSAHAAGLGSWNRSEQRAVVQAGLLDGLPDGRFHGEARLTGAQLGSALGAVAARADEPAVA